MGYSDLLFSLGQFNSQYFSQLSRYFKEVLGDFGPHQIIPVLTSLSPSPPYNPAGDGSMHNHVGRRFPLFFNKQVRLLHQRERISK